MKEHEIFIGIDVSKEKLDVSVLVKQSGEPLYHCQYDNTTAGIRQIISSVRKKTKVPSSTWLFCMEHTGVYAMPLCYILSEAKLDYAVVAGSEILRSIGLKRGKSDQADSGDIAKYACLREKDIRLYQLPEKSLMKLKLLLSHRERLLKAKRLFKTTTEEITAFTDKTITKEMVKDSKVLVKTIDRKIASVEKLIEQLVQSEPQLYQAYQLAMSVPGVGPQISCYLLVYTRCFTSFDNARQLACYAGIAPFEYSSGSSIRGRTKVSHLANKKLKSLFSMGALNAKRVDQELKLYYERKIKEGKNAMLVMNAIRNKMVHRIVATVKRGTPFVPLMKFAA